MPARLSVTVVTTALLLAACSSHDEPGSAGSGAASQACPVPAWDATEVRRVELRRLDPGGPLLDRDLRVTRARNGDLCLEIVVDHADPGSTAVSYRIDAREGTEERRQDGEDPSGQRPLRVAGDGCVTARAELEVLGAGDRAYPYRARLRLHCDGQAAGH